MSLTTDEVLEYLQVNLRTVCQLINPCKISAVRVGRRWQFRKKDIDAWHERGQAELKRMRLLGYDLLLTALKMPGIDRLTVIQDVRHLDVTVSTVITTQFSSEASAIEAANLGVSGYLTKPFMVPKVLSVAARVLGD